jgi:hypothetical protein
VAGKHERPTNWIAVTTWTVKRIVILAVAVFVGAWVLKNGFPGNASGAITGIPTPTASSSRTPGVSPSSSPTKVKRRKPADVIVQVLNAGAPTGDAGIATDFLKSKHYKTLNAGDTSPDVTRSVVYYAADSKAEAHVIQTKWFTYALFRPAPASFPSTVDVTIVLGPDYQALPSPSPSH